MTDVGGHSALRVWRGGRRPLWRISFPSGWLGQLTDEAAFPDEALIALYASRWQVELHFRQLKTNLALDVLRGLSPAMIERELWMHALAYNLVRALILEAARTYSLPVTRFSFQAPSTLQAWSAQLRPKRRPPSRHALLGRLAANLVTLRPGRHEPRARKRHPSTFPALQRHRRLNLCSARGQRRKPKNPPRTLS